MAKAVPIPAKEHAPSGAAGGLWWQKRFREHVLPRLVLIPLCALFLLPLYWMLAVALKPTLELSDYPPTWWPN